MSKSHFLFMYSRETTGNWTFNSRLRLKKHCEICMFLAVDHSKKCDKQRCTCREKLCTNRFLQVWLSTYYSTELCMDLTGNIRILLCLGNFQKKFLLTIAKVVWMELLGALKMWKTNFGKQYMSDKNIIFLCRSLSVLGFLLYMFCSTNTLQVT